MDAIEAVYFESHITLEPFPFERVTELNVLCSTYGFGTADLTKKTTNTICTAKGVEAETLITKTKDLVKELQTRDFVVTRYKLESVLLDVRPYR